MLSAELKVPNVGTQSTKHVLKGVSTTTIQNKRTINNIMNEKNVQ